MSAALAGENRCLWAKTIYYCFCARTSGWRASHHGSMCGSAVAPLEQGNAFGEIRHIFSAWASDMRAADADIVMLTVETTGW